MLHDLTILKGECYKSDNFGEYRNVSALNWYKTNDHMLPGFLKLKPSSFKNIPI